MSGTRRPASAALLLAALALAVACALPGLGPPGGAGETFRLSSVAGEGDARQRASTRLVLDGLAADAALRPDAAVVLYERALQLDPTNPWAFLALARHRVEGPTPRAALPALDQAEAMLRSRGELAPGVEAHLLGLRGSVLLTDERRDEALPLLRRARELSPSIWSDARLEAEELR